MQCLTWRCGFRELDPADPNHCEAMNPHVIAFKIQPSERRALPQHPRQAPRPCCTYAITPKIQCGEGRAPPQHPRSFLDTSDPCTRAWKPGPDQESGKNNTFNGRIFA